MTVRRISTGGASAIAVVVLAVAGVAPAATAQSEESTTSSSVSSTAESASDETPLEETTESAEASSTAAGEPVSPKTESGSCVDVFALGVQGTGQSSLTTPRDIDGGFLGEILGHMFTSKDSQEAQSVKAQFAREYIPYDAGWGGFGNMGTMTYRDSVSGGIKALEKRATEILDECPSTYIVPIGFSQGADVTDHFLENVGNGSSSVPAESILAGFNMGAPARREAQPIAEGGRVNVDIGADTPAIDSLEEITAPVPDGAGLTATGDHVESYGALDGRVVSFCEHGDLVCDMPADAPAARALAKLATSVTMKGDPFRALDQLSDALIMSPLDAASSAVNEDVQGETLDSVSFTPSKSISERLEEAAARDPEELSGESSGSTASTESETASESEAAMETATQPGLDVEESTETSSSALGARSSAPSVAGTAAMSGSDTLTNAGAALGKLGLLGVNAVIAIARETFTPDTIAQVAGVGLVNPAAALPVLGAKVAASATKVMAPVGVQGASAAFEVAQAEVDSNEGLVRLATDVNYWSHWQKHSSYNHVPVDASGDSAMEYVRKFLTAATQDIAAKPEESESSESSSSEYSSESSTATSTETSEETAESVSSSSSETTSASQTTTAG